jgi:hypothetical protein
MASLVLEVAVVKRVQRDSFEVSDSAAHKEPYAL